MLFKTLLSGILNLKFIDRELTLGEHSILEILDNIVSSFPLMIFFLDRRSIAQEFLTWFVTRKNYYYGHYFS